ncbi:SDR family NAD(P)-dependent oxidoreductase [Legionella jordanis]|uniref:Short chain dehydrogenase/reductase family oxidoreductase n=1 Tax=Legionella jordanis TaxID=456 RepID=A0A0W0VCA2_9GAMM|nr:SDR family NAD(P)-dependent oxidoreductase [Legionella jordanis]KTD17257.1 short chain dehydrogenase/reductase family oxidoreductase [Legionella jordanis]RMX03371.1 SDR family NAD(P)-dependent oxidoreductase [Legionella jordanis]RMX15849.1 SDR family NAD(P)-dependent oxidoreductase [Legionella jordanis]VEH12546.1 short chain dehydrogenase/reductase family oxidoreductase [Legionella jordanis]HAT8713380.1 SDR family NAD(P)-dependent oxidoreductase [Legionella jordanis]
MQTMNNKIIFITGASSGIGEACARIFAASGAKLILSARRTERLKTLAEHLEEAHGTKSHILRLDVRSQEEVDTQISNLPKDWQPIDVLINNAGLALSSDPLQQGHIENWDTMIDTNIKGLLYVSRKILPGMLERNHGHVINIGSVAGEECYPGGNVYCATKHAVRAISKSMRLDLLGTAIRVTEIAPGAVETEFSEVRWNDKQKAKAFYNDFTPLSPADIADAVFYSATRPPHVDISVLSIMPTVQASAQNMFRNKRD